LFSHFKNKELNPDVISNLPEKQLLAFDLNIVFIEL